MEVTEIPNSEIEWLKGIAWSKKEEVAYLRTVDKTIYRLVKDKLERLSEDEASAAAKLFGGKKAVVKVASAVTDSKKAWAYVSYAVRLTASMFGIFDEEIPKEYTVVLQDLKSKKEQSVTFSSEITNGMRAMAFCGDRLLVGGAKLVWVRWKAA